MKRLTTTFLSILLTLSVFCQTNTEIRASKQAAAKANEALILKNRQLVIQQLNEQNYTGLLSIVDETNSLIDTSLHTAFYTWEIQLLSVLSDNLDRFFAVTINFPSIYQSIEPCYDNLGYIAISKINGNEAYWKNWYNQQTRTDEEMQVLRIFLGSIGLYPDNPENRKIVKEFRKEYPTTEYMDFVDLRAPLFATGSWNINVGYGFIGLNGDVSKLTKLGSSFTMGTGGLFNRLFLAVFFTTGKSKLLYSIEGITPDSGSDFDVAKGEKLNYMCIGAKFGWQIYKGQFIKIIPNISVSSLSINIPAVKNRNNDPYTLNAAAGFGAGVIADFDIFNWKSKPQYGQSTCSHLGIRLGVSYNQYISRDDLDGSSLELEAAFIWWIGD